MDKHGILPSIAEEGTRTSRRPDEVVGMTREEWERMFELCSRISAETDHRKLSELVRELNDLLDAKIIDSRSAPH